jgi:TolA-binding protein
MNRLGIFRPAMAATCWLLLAAAPVALAQQPPARGGAGQDFARAEQLFQEERWEEALEAFRNFQKEWSLTRWAAAATYYEAWALFNLERYQEAIVAFEKLLTTYRQTPFAGEAFLKMVECYVQIKDYDKARALYREFPARFPNHELIPQALVGEAWILLRQQQHAEAKTIVQRVLAHVPAESSVYFDALFLLGEILTAEQRYDEARAVYTTIARHRNNPRAADALMLAGDTLAKAGRCEDAIRFYKRVQPGKALVETVTNLLRQLEAQRHQYIHNMSLFESRRQALLRQKSLLEGMPDRRPRAIFAIARCYQELDKPEEASVVYRYFLQAYPEDRLDPTQHALHEQAHFHLATTLKERGLLEESDAEFARFRQRYPNSPYLTGASFIQADAMFAAGRYEEAIRLYREARDAAQDPQVIQTAEFRIGSCLIESQQLPAARDAFAEFLQRHPDSELAPAALFQLGRAQFDIAIESQQAGNDEIWHAELAASAATYEKLLESHRDSELASTGLLKLGYLHGLLGAFDPTGFEKAIARFQQFRERYPDDPRVAEATYQLARAHLALRNLDEAAALYREVMEKYPASPSAPLAAYEIASVHASRNAPDAMLAALRLYVERFPADTNVPDAMYAIGFQLENTAMALERQRQPQAEETYAEALDEYRRLIERGVLAGGAASERMMEASFAALLRVVDHHERRGRADDAVAECARYLQAFNENPRVVRNLVPLIAGVYVRARRFADAYEKMDRLRDEYRLNPEIRLATNVSTIELALAQRENSRAYAAALRLEQDPAAKDGLSGAAYLAIGGAMLATDRHEQARDALQRALQASPNDDQITPHAMLRLGQALSQLKELDKARELFERLIEQYPAFARRNEARLGLARIHYQADRVKEALPIVMDLYRLPGDTAAEAAFLGGKMYYELKTTDPEEEKANKKTALALFSRVIFQGRGEMVEESWFLAGESHAFLGNHVDACRLWSSYLRQFAEGRYAQEIRARVAAHCSGEPRR